MNSPMRELRDFVRQLESGEQIYFSPELRELAAQAVARKANRPAMTPEEQEALVDRLAVEAATITD